MLLQPLQAIVRSIAALNLVYMAAVDRPANILGRVIQRFPLDPVSGQRSILVPLRLVVSLRLLRRHVLEHHASVLSSLVIILLRLEGCWLLEFWKGRFVQVRVGHGPQLMPVRTILAQVDPFLLIRRISEYNRHPRNQSNQLGSSHHGSSSIGSQRSTLVRDSALEALGKVR